MKILFLTGMSGSGKTTIAEKLCEDEENFNLINSYTDRQMRDRNETGHVFVSPQHMDMLLESADVVAKTDIEGKRYCSLASQFDTNKINVYVVDAYGINDTIKYFPLAEVLSILIKREEVEVDCVRARRDIAVPARQDVDFCVDNNYKIDSAVNVVKLLINLESFSKPSHTVQTTIDKIKDIEGQERYLQSIKESLLSELWYEYRQSYINLIDYVKNKINEEFDFNIDIHPDTKPEIFDGYLVFNVILEYTDTDIDWATMHDMVEKASHYAHTYGLENDVYELIMRLQVCEEYVGEI